MGEIDPAADSAAMLDGFRNQPADPDAGTRARMDAVAAAQVQADAQLRADTDQA